MKKEQKSEIIDGLGKTIAERKNFYITDVSTLTVVPKKE